MTPEAAALTVSARLELRLSDAAEAERARSALAPESAGFLQLGVQGEHLLIVVPAGSVGRTLATLDDALSCLQAALDATAQAP